MRLKGRWVKWTYGDESIHECGVTIDVFVGLRVEHPSMKVITAQYIL